MARYIDPRLYSLFTAEAVGQLYWLLEVDFDSGTRYWGPAAVTWRSQAYTAIVESIEGLEESWSDPMEDKLKIRLLNQSGTLRTLVQDREFLDSRVRIRLVSGSLASTTTPAYSGTVGARTCAVNSGYPTPDALDGLWTFTWNSGTGLWTPSFERHDGVVTGYGTFGGTTGGTFTAAGLMSVTITGTYGAGQNGDVWSVRTTGNFLFWAGKADPPDRVDENFIEFTARGIVAAQMVAPIPRRLFVRRCQNVFGPVAASLTVQSMCGYSGPSSTASGAGTASVTLTPASITPFRHAKGSSIKIGASGTPVVVDAVGTSTITLAAARTWANADGIFFTDCSKIFNACIDRERQHEFGGERGISSTLGVINRRNRQTYNTYPGTQYDPKNATTDTKKGLQRVSKPVPEPDVPLRLVYGLRVVDGIPIELFAFDDDGGRQFKAIHYALGAGEHPSVSGDIGFCDRKWIGGKKRENVVKTSGGDEYLDHGCYFRRGTAAVTGAETNAAYNTDSDQEVRPQNTDFQGGAGTARSRVAWALFRGPRDNDTMWGEPGEPDTYPDAQFRILGRVVQKYLRNGATDGARVHSYNPIWIALDMMTDPYDGAGISIDDMAIARIKDAADYCDALIDSVEADTKADGNQTTVTNLDVDSAGGFRFKKGVWLNGVDTGETVEHIKGTNTIGLSGPITVVDGDRIHQKVPRFEASISIEDRQTVFDAVMSVLRGCRGYLCAVDGLVVIDIDREVATELLVDGGFETWASSTNLTVWSEGLTGGSTINRESTIINGGAFSIRMAIDSSGNPAEIAVDLGTLTPGGVYVARVVAQAASWVGGESVKIKLKNTAGAGTYLQADGTWAATAVYIDLPIKESGWQDLFYMFRADPHITGSTHQIYIRSGTGLASRNLYLDDASVFGPCGGEFRDQGGPVLQQRAMILGEDGDFSSAPEDPRLEYNEVQVTFKASIGGNMFPPEESSFTAVDESHRAEHVTKGQSVDCPGLVSFDEAARIAKYHLYRSRVLGEGSSFAGMAAALLPSAGDVVILSHRAPGWSRRLHRLETVSIPRFWPESEVGEFRVELDLEHWDPAIYTDAGEKGELGIGYAEPTITLSAVAAKGRVFELGWVPSVGDEPIQHYEIHVSTSTISSTLPDGDTLKAKKKGFSYKYQAKRSEAGGPLYARVFGILKNGDFVASNEVNVTDALDTLDDIADGDDRQLAVTILSLVKDGDFTDGSGWTKNAHGGSASVSGGLAHLNANGHTGSTYPTIFRPFPEGGVNDRRPFPLGAVISVALSFIAATGTPNGNLQVILFSGAEVGDDSETNYTLIHDIAFADIISTLRRIPVHYTFGASAPALPAGGTAYKIGLRLKGSANAQVDLDKFDVAPGAQPLDGWNFLGHADDLRNNIYPDYTSTGAAAGGGNLGGGKYPIGGPRTYDDFF